MIIILIWGVAIYAAKQIGKNRNFKNENSPLLWGIFLGWIGVLIVALHDKKKDKPLNP